MTDKALTDKGRLVDMMLNCPTVTMDFDAAFCLADHLIANGVVVQRQGEWVFDHTYASKQKEKYNCSVCGYCYSRRKRRPADRKRVSARYCPNCFAKMVKEDK